MEPPSPPVRGSSRFSVWRKKKRKLDENNEVNAPQVNEPEPQEELLEDDNENNLEGDNRPQEGGAVLLQEQSNELPENSSSSESESDSNFELEQDFSNDDTGGGDVQSDDVQSDDVQSDEDPIYNAASETESSSSSSSEGEEEEGPILNMNADCLQEPLVVHEPRTVKEALLLDIALSLRHKHTYEALIQGLESKNVLFGKKFFPTRKKGLWKACGRTKSGIVAHIYCPDCKIYVGKKKALLPQVACPGCQKLINVRKAKYFITVSLKKQLKDFLSRPNAATLLSYRKLRRKLNPENIEDIFDGAEFKRIAIEVDMKDDDLTCVLNTDGCKISKNAKTTVYPVFVRLNELKPRLRQKHIFLAAVFVDSDEPNMNALFKPVAKQLNQLSKHGVEWESNGERKLSRLFPICFCVDAKARAQMLNMVTHSGYYCCTYCTFKGIRMDNTTRFPTRPHPDVPPHCDRTDKGMRDDMMEATQRKRQGESDKNSIVRGHKGATVLGSINHLDLARGSAADDLHNLYECAVKEHVNLLLTVVPRVPKDLGYDAMCDIIDARMKTIKTPSCISRKPANPKNSIKNRETWKGTQWRDFLFYYGVPCLQGLIASKYLQHFELLSKFGFTLSLTSVSMKDLEDHQTCIIDYLKKFEEFFGTHRTRLNMHGLVHAIASCRNLGPYWVYSTFNFESWNFQILQTVSSPKGAILQIVMRHLFLSYMGLVCSSDADDVSDEIREQLNRILCKKARQKAALKISDSVYVVGNPVVRAPTDAERLTLAKEDFFPNEIRIYSKMIVDSINYQCPTSSLQTDDSCIYTHDNTFCTVCDVVMFDDGGQQQCGLFVKEHQVSLPFKHVTHIARITEGEDILYFLQSEKVCSPAIKMECLNRTFIAAMPNTFGVD